MTLSEKRITCTLKTERTETRETVDSRFFPRNKSRRDRFLTKNEANGARGLIFDSNHYFYKKPDIRNLRLWGQKPGINFRGLQKGNKNMQIFLEFGVKIRRSWKMKKNKTLFRSFETSDLLFVLFLIKKSVRVDFSPFPRIFTRFFVKN